jgi:endonuclease/exonuclease/phosphatase family metal-dependent hydrolase
MLVEEDADVVCFQEVAFYGCESLIDKINAMLARPYLFTRSAMSEKYTLQRRSKNAQKKWAAGLLESDGEFLTDGLAVLTKSKIVKYEVEKLRKAPPDQNHRPDFRIRIAQNVETEAGLKITNVHFASNQNSYLQLRELISKNADRLIVGDFNMTESDMQEHENIWRGRYKASTDFLPYVSFPDDVTAYDYLLLPEGYKFVAIRVINGLSDHSALVFEVEKG